MYSDIYFTVLPSLCCRFMFHLTAEWDQKLRGNFRWNLFIEMNLADGAFYSFTLCAQWHKFPFPSNFSFLLVLLVSTSTGRGTWGFRVILAVRPNPGKPKWGRSLLLIFEHNKRLLLWIKYDPGVLSLLFHRKARQEWCNTVLDCIWFPISSHFLIVSVSASGSYFEKRLSKEENISVTHPCRWCWRG